MGFISFGGLHFFEGGLAPQAYAWLRLCWYVMLSESNGGFDFQRFVCFR